MVGIIISVKIETIAKQNKIAVNGFIKALAIRLVKDNFFPCTILLLPYKLRCSLMVCSLNPVKEVLKACNISLVELVAQKIICSFIFFSVLGLVVTMLPP